MRWMLWGRQHGKTHQTLLWFKEDPEHRVILCMNEMEAVRLRRLIERDYPHDQHRLRSEAEAWRILLRRNIITVGTWQREFDHARWVEGDARPSYPKVAIDNAEHVLRTLVGAEVELLTATGMNETPEFG